MNWLSAGRSTSTGVENTIQEQDGTYSVDCHFYCEALEDKSVRLLQIIAC
jgi:hypothetical protein